MSNKVKDINIKPEHITISMSNKVTDINIKT